MTSHQFAQKLLEGPDLPIWHPKITGYDQDEESPLYEPAVSPAFATHGGDPDTDHDILIISYKPI